MWGDSKDGPDGCRGSRGENRVTGLRIGGTAEVVVLPSDQDASGRSLGASELARLVEVIESGKLTSTRGEQVSELESGIGAIFGCGEVIACSSGTSAIHAAIAAIDPEPGDEIVTSPVTDIGAITPILYQGAIPVFADVSPLTGNVTAASVADRISPRTRGVIVTHLFGNPAAVDEIVDLCAPLGIAVIEDCSQAWMARRGGQFVGTIGDFGVFSTQQGKHLTTGEGGILLARDPGRARRARLFVNKAWSGDDPRPDHEFLALNARMTELQGAVGNAQLAKLCDFVDHRHKMSTDFLAAVDAIDGIAVVHADPADVASWWRIPVLVDRGLCSPDALAEELSKVGVAALPRYIRKPVFECKVIAEQRTFGSSHWPFTLARPEALDYSRSKFTGTGEFLDSVLVFPFNERYEPEHVSFVVNVLSEAVQNISGMVS